MPWISSAEHDRLLEALDAAERRAYSAEASLAAERAANREAERWWADMMLRKAGSFPLSAKRQPSPPADTPELEPVSEVPGMDPGELEALVTVGAEYGQTRADVVRALRRERNLE